MDASPIDRIEIVTRWIGLADPPTHEARLILVREGIVYRRQRLPEQFIDDVPAARIIALARSLDYPCQPKLDPAMFDFSEEVIRWHYESMWTDDCPSHRVTLDYASGRRVTIATDSQHGYMLPLMITESAGQTANPTFDPRVSQAIAALMPDDYLEVDRLAGRGGMLAWDAQDYPRRMEALASKAATEVATDDVPSQCDVAMSIDEAMEEIHRVLFPPEAGSASD